jgi:hypothetical protein
LAATQHFASHNFVRLESDAGEWVGQGRSYSYTQANAVLTVTSTDGHLSVEVRGNETWLSEFQLPGRDRLQAGTFTEGFNWFRDVLGCGAVTGSFTIEHVRYAGDNLTAIDLGFEQHCEGGPAALRGRIHWRRDDPTRPSGPVLPVPPGLWQPALGLTPTTGDYVFLQSDAGDWIGQGRTTTLTQSNSTITVTADQGRINVRIDGDSWWFGDFEAMSTLSQLQAGYYPDLHRFPLHNPAKGGLSWFGEGRGCDTLRGWFAVDRATYDGPNLTGLDLRFEQRCGAGAPALRGAIHWNSLG